MHTPHMSPITVHGTKQVSKVEDALVVSLLARVMYRGPDHPLTRAAERDLAAHGEQGVPK